MDMFFILTCSSQLVFSVMSSTGYLPNIASSGAETALLLGMEGRCYPMLDHPLEAAAAETPFAG